MRNILYFIGSTIYGCVFSYLLWLLFYCLTPWLMSFGWLGIIVYWILAGGLISGLIGGLASFLFIPLFFMISKCKGSKYIPALCLLFFGFSSIMCPWRLDMEYSFVKIIIAVSISLTALIVYSTLVLSLFKKEI